MAERPAANRDLSRQLRGVPAAPGTALGTAWVYRPEQAEGDDRLGVDEAAAQATAELEALAARLRVAGREDEAGILDAQALMAGDPELLDEARRRVGAGARASEAIVSAGDVAAATLAALDDDLLAARAADVRDVAERIARAVRGDAPPRLERRSVAVAVDLPPSVTAELDPQLLAGIALEAGSPTAHAAILARALGIPAVVGVAGLLASVDETHIIGLDGNRGTIVVDPEAGERRRLEEAIAGERRQAAADVGLRDVPLATSDGHHVMLAANIGRPDEAGAALAAGAEGIGLFRTEFMFMGRVAAPAEVEQVRAYASVLAAFGARPVVVRLLDVGGDKRLPYLDLPLEENPFLGVRAVRLARRQPELLAVQLRAILRAALETGAQPWIMVPMVADLDDARLVRAMLGEAAASVPGGREPRLGIMVEVPSAALLADQLAAEVDFFSIGTNDLTQYLLAADRTNAALAAWQDPMHPAVLRAVRAIVDAARRHATPVAVCGEMAGDPTGAVALVGLGVDELSMDPRAFGRVKRRLTATPLATARQLAAAACEAPSAGDARRIVSDGAPDG